MKKLIFGFVALSALFMVACKKSSNSPSNNASQNIIGTWKITGSGTKFYDANNNLLASLHDPYNLIGTTLKFSSTYYYDYSGDAPDSAQYTLNTSVSPMVVTIGVNNDNGDMYGTASILSLTNSQMIWQVEETGGTNYIDTTTNNLVSADHAIDIDTLTKQ